MAKCIFHKGQRVFVKPLGTWARILQVLPQWVNGLEEPIKIHYDLDLGREFTGEDLTAETASKTLIEPASDTPDWRIVRRENKCGTNEEDHPVPGTHPVVLTDEKDWGGWRVPTAEYERNPARIEFQARILAQSPDLMDLAKHLVEIGNKESELPQSVQTAVREAQRLLSDIYRTAAA